MASERDRLKRRVEAVRRDIRGLESDARGRGSRTGTPPPADEDGESRWSWGAVNIFIMPSILIIVGLVVTSILGNIWFFLAFLFWAIDSMFHISDVPIGPFGFNPPKQGLRNLKALLNFSAFVSLTLAFVMSDLPSAGFIAIIVGFIAYFSLGR